MSTEPIDRKVREIIAFQLGISEEDIQPDSTFVDDLGADSLDVVELLMALEEEFDIEIPDEDAEEFETVENVINYIRAKQQ